MAVVMMVCDPMLCCVMWMALPPRVCETSQNVGVFGFGDGRASAFGICSAEMAVSRSSDEVMGVAERARTSGFCDMAVGFTE